MAGNTTTQCGLRLFGLAVLALSLVCALVPTSRAYAQVLTADSTTISTQSSSSTTEDSSLTVKSYRIKATLDTKKNRLSVSVIATVKNNTRKTFKQLYFRNMASTMLKRAKANSIGNEGKKAVITSARNLTSKTALKFKALEKDASIVRVKLGKKALKPGKTIKIQLKASIGMPRYDGSLGFHKDAKGRLYSFCWCFPYLADYRNGSWTLNSLPKIGENRFARTAKYQVTFKAPKGYKVAASGASSTKRGVTTVKAAKLRDFALVACNYMKKDVGRVNGIKIVNWYLPGAYATQYRKDVMLPAKDAVRYLSAHVGTLPYKEIDLVQVFCGFTDAASGSMEYPGLVALEGDRYYYRSESGKVDKGLLTRTTFHEVAHQWFYACVGNDEYTQPWLDEGITSYYERWALWSESTDTTRYLASVEGLSVDEFLQSQRETFRASLSGAESGLTSTKLNRNVKAYQKTYFASLYNMGAWFLVQLQETVGADAFDAIMHDYYKTYRLKEATIEGFLAVVRAHDNSEEVQALIAKYF